MAIKIVGGCHYYQMNDLLLVDVHDLHVEWTMGTATIARTTVIGLGRPVYLLSQTVLDRKFVIRLKARKSFQQLHLLLDQQLINRCKIFQTGWTVRNSLRHIHPAIWKGCKHTCKVRSVTAEQSNQFVIAAVNNNKAKVISLELA